MGAKVLSCEKSQGIFFPGLQTCEVLKVLDEDDDINRTRICLVDFDATTFYSGREIIYLEHRRRLEDGSVLVVCRSIEYPGAPKPKRGYIRVRLDLQAFLVSAVQKRDNVTNEVAIVPDQCNVCLISIMDTRQNAASWVSNRFIKAVPMIVESAATIADKRSK